MGKNLVLAGGGHAHMMLLANIKEIVSSGHSVTVIQPSDHHYYSGMGPGMLSTVYSPDVIRFNTQFVVERQGGTFVKAKVTRFDPTEEKVYVDTGESYSYDVLSCNCGSYVPFDHISGNRDSIFSAKPIERLLEAQKKILNHCKNGSVSIAVIGGGPAAIEIAGNSYHLAKTTNCKSISVTLFAGNKMMGGFSQKIQHIVRKTFADFAITIDESGYVEKIDDGTIFTENGKQHKPDIIFMATGVKPSSVFSASGITLGEDGGLPVNSYLQNPEFSNIFGGGDCIYHIPQPLAKVGVYAVRENPVLLHNVRAALDGLPLKLFDPGGNYLLIFNLGRGLGALQKGPITWGGKLSFVIKDYIDRKFMREFQELEK